MYLAPYVRVECSGGPKPCPNCVVSIAILRPVCDGENGSLVQKRYSWGIVMFVQQFSVRLEIACTKFGLNSILFDNITVI